MHIDNNWYGHRKIFAEYCGLEDQPAFASIQHGWVSKEIKEKYQTILGKRTFSVAPYLCWDREIADLAKKNKIYNVVPIGSPFLYFCDYKNIKYKIDEKNTSGVLAFPFHSTPEENIEFKHGEFIREVENNFSPPFTVCLYNTDYIKKNIELYTKNNWKVITIGKRSDSNFINSLFNEIISYEYIICSEVFTTFYYSLYLKKKCKLISYYIENNEKKFFRNSITNYKIFLQNKYIKKYPFLVKGSYKIDEIYSLATKELGKENFRDKNTIKKLFGWSNFSKKIISRLVYKFIDLKYGRNLRNS